MPEEPQNPSSPPSGPPKSTDLPTKEERSRAIIGQIEAKLASGATEAVQEELAESILLLDVIKKQDEDLTGLIAVVVNALFSEQPNLALAKKLRMRLKARLRSSEPSFGPINLAFGLAIFAYVAIPAFLGFCFVWKQPKILDLQSQTVLAVAISGACGSIVSILQRIQDFRAKAVDRTVLIFQGFFKPIVGSLFALFVFFAIEGNVIPITHAADTAVYFFIALAFVCGFSERFATDIVSQTEGVAGGAVEDKKTLSKVA